MSEQQGKVHFGGKREADVGYVSMRDLLPAEVITECPKEFAGNLRRPRKFCGSTAMYGVLREGIFLAAKNSDHVKRNKFVRKTNLALAKITYHEKAATFVITGKENGKRKMKMKLFVMQSEFHGWLENLLAHRLYAQSVMPGTPPSTDPAKGKQRVLKAANGSKTESVDWSALYAPMNGKESAKDLRQQLPAPMTPRPSLMKLIVGMIGTDLTNVSLPAVLMQPRGILQMLCEELEYSNLIDCALKENDAALRMAYISAFAISRYAAVASCASRKPFQPLLGETYEYQDPVLGWKYLAEQVNRRPPTSVGHAEGCGWTFFHECTVDGSLKASLFSAPTLKILTGGTVVVRLEERNETYHWKRVDSEITGLSGDNPRVDFVGTKLVKCVESLMTCKVVFEKSKRNRITGMVTNLSGTELLRLNGAWDDSFETKSGKLLWKRGIMPPNHKQYYGMSVFAMGLNAIEPNMRGTLPNTDSRFRPDMRALESGLVEEAEKVKKELESQQRNRREVKAGLWFDKSGPGATEKTGQKWSFNDRYWEAKKDHFVGVKFPNLW